MEVHSSSSGAGSDENLSSSDMSERSGEHEHDYEDIYMIREDPGKQQERSNAARSRSRDSGSHSRSASTSSSNSGCNVIVKVPTTNRKDSKKSNDFLPKPQKYENYDKLKNMKKESQESGLSSTASTLSSEDDGEKTKLGVRHSLPPPKTGTVSATNTNSRLLKRVTSVPADISPPPPPPPLPMVKTGDETKNNEDEMVEVVEEPTVRPSDVVRGMCRSISSICK